MSGALQVSRKRRLRGLSGARIRAHKNGSEHGHLAGRIVCVLPTNAATPRQIHRINTMKQLFLSITAVAALLAAIASHAQVPASAPSGTTGLCKDGTFDSRATKKGACTGH